MTERLANTASRRGLNPKLIGLLEPRFNLLWKTYAHPKAAVVSSQIRTVPEYSGAGCDDDVGEKHRRIVYELRWVE